VHHVPGYRRADATAAFQLPPRTLGPKCQIGSFRRMSSAATQVGPVGLRGCRAAAVVHVLVDRLEQLERHDRGPVVVLQRFLIR